MKYHWPYILNSYQDWSYNIILHGPRKMHYKISYPKVDIVSILSSLLCVCPECRVILLASQCKHYSAHKKSMRTNEMEEFMLEWTLPPDTWWKIPWNVNGLSLTWWKIPPWNILEAPFWSYWSSHWLFDACDKKIMSHWSNLLKWTLLLHKLSSPNTWAWMALLHWPHNREELLYSWEIQSYINNEILNKY